ncbi:metalloregulator ArsR/SmtB family transcription factor [Hydrocarboniphaga effusa]|jgi:DNA-binding MarR family transcriptional regulator|uniref:metalloregulator ArsR/SmtB family transcription factor n=1 Tax=Hydrocarboniphaga effusa TaxID=243629 RepID=UPI0031378289
MSVDALLAALADPARRGLFESLTEPASVSDLASRHPITRGAVSQHLKVLVEAGLVDVRPQGRMRIYSRRPESLRALAQYAIAMDKVSEAGPQDAIASELGKWQAEAPNIDYGVLALMMYFTQIGHHVVSSSEAVAERAGLSFADVALLGALRRLGPPYESTSSRLARTFWISLPGMTKRLGRLEAAGLLIRSVDADDRRSALLRLTDKGLSVLRDLVANQQPAEYHALLQLSAAEREQLSSLLPRLLDLIDTQHGQRRPAYRVR